MRRAKHLSPDANATPPPATRHGIWAGLGVFAALVWSVVGVLLAAFDGKSRVFLYQWLGLQGFPLIAIGVWLLQIARSGTLGKRMASAMREPYPPESAWNRKRAQLGIILLIGTVGSASIIGLGFPASGTLLGYYWVTSVLIAFIAAAVTAHVVEILSQVTRLSRANVNVFKYAPARTPEIKSIVAYVSSFTVLVTIGYAFAVLATLASMWTGPAEYVDAVRVFWPIIYVPLCSAAVVYPHLVVHGLIRREKEKILISCQEDIDGLLSRFRELEADDIGRTNTLAQLFDRIAATPDYVIDFGIATRLAIPLVVNALSFFAKTAYGYVHTGHP